MRSPHTTREEPSRAVTRKNESHSNEDPAQPKIKNKILKNDENQANS